jgi:hypothetical protein
VLFLTPLQFVYMFCSLSKCILPSLNMPVQRLKVAVLPLDLPCFRGNFNHWQVSRIFFKRQLGCGIYKLHLIS